MPTQRTGWASFITDPVHAGRFLLPGADSAWEYSDALEQDVLETFLEALANADLSTKILAGAHFLCHPKLIRFFEAHVPALLRHLQHGTTAHIETSRTGAKGKINWPETLRIQLQLGFDRSTYRVTRVQRSVDLPENQLLAWFIREVFELSKFISSQLGSGTVLASLAKVERTATLALKDPYLRNASRISSPTPIHFARANRNRDWRYSELATLSKQLDRAIKKNKWEAIFELLKDNWLAPVKDEDLFELFALVLTLDILDLDLGCGPPIEYGLVLRGRNHVAHFRDATSDASIYVYFDQSATRTAGITSEYLKTVSEHVGITGAPRRPDILIACHSPGQRPKYLLLEVKETSDSGYARESVYKALAYLRDLSQLWQDQEGVHPKALVMFPTGIAPKTAVNRPLTGDLIMVSGDERERLSQLLHSWLRTPSTSLSS